MATKHRKAGFYLGSVLPGLGDFPVGPSSRPRHGRAETNRSRCHRVFASRIRLIHAAKPHQCRPLRVSKARYKIHSDPISRMKPELNKANNSVAAQCPTCHATTSFDAHDASVNLQL
jgi:hypothetical protein